MYAPKPTIGEVAEPNGRGREGEFEADFFEALAVKKTRL
jgi:hypothetical protein